MRRISATLFLLVSLIGGASTALAPAASATVDGCGFVGNLVAPAEDDCRATMAFVDGTIDRQADNVFFVFCTVFPTHPACP
jgi:hypothetical protein